LKISKNAFLVPLNYGNAKFDSPLFVGDLFRYVVHRGVEEGKIILCSPIDQGSWPLDVCTVTSYSKN